MFLLASSHRASSRFMGLRSPKWVSDCFHPSRLDERTGRRGFTLVELMVIIAIISLLAALLIPTLQTTREAARRTQCANNLKQVTMAILNITEASRAFPSGTTLLNVTGTLLDVTTANATWCRAGTTDGYTPWTVIILPFLEQQDLFDGLTLDMSLAGRFMDDTFVVPPSNGDAQNIVPLSVLHCPSSRYTSAVRNNYFGVQGGGVAACTNNPPGTGTQRFFMNGVLHANSRVGFASLRDGASHVLMVGETRWCSHQTALGEQFNWLLSGKSGADAIPIQVAGMEQAINAQVSEAGSRLLNWATRGFGSDHVRGCFFSVCDGSIRFFADSADLPTLQLLAGRNDGGLIQSALTP